MSTSCLLPSCFITADSLPPLAKVAPQKASQTNDCLTNSAKSLPTNASTSHKDQAENTLRRSRRLQGIPVPDSNSNDTMLSAPASFPAKTVPNGTIASTDSDSVHNSAPLKHAQDPRVSVRDASQPDIDNSNKADNETDGPEATQDKDEDNDDDDDESNKPLQPKQKRRKGTSATSSRKRKADTSGGKKTAESGLDPPVKKKQKVDKPTTKQQRKAGNSKPKTAKERFQAASAKDTRPLPWGQPEVWADVCSFHRMNVNSQR